MEEFTLQQIDEAVECILSGGSGLESIQDLIKAVSRGDAARCKEILEDELDVGSVLDDGVYHLPKENLGDLINELLVEAEDLAEGASDEDEED